MTSRFDGYVVLAEMRTGSNFLEESLRLMDGVACHGEVFNPAFIGAAGREEMFGIDLKARERDPLSLLDALIRQSDGLGGFRFFHNHDPRVLEAILPNPRIAKIVLMRNPLESYVSLKIAQATGQWRLSNLRDRKAAKPSFDAAEFEEMLGRLQAFQRHVAQALQRSGQTAFHLAYEDLGDLETLNGLAAYLGVRGRLTALPSNIRPQNPGALRDKVANPEEMERALAGLDRFTLGRMPLIEPARGTSVPCYIVAEAGAGLLHVPVPGGPQARITAWLSDVAGAPPQEGLSRKTLRQWRNRHKRARSFTVVRHPVARAWEVFCTVILSDGPAAKPGIRRALIDLYDAPLPQEAAPPGVLAPEALRVAFLAFLRFAKANNAGQTGHRPDPLWASQSAVLAGEAGVVVPDRILREADLARGLADLADEVGAQMVPLSPPIEPGPCALADAYDDAIEEAARSLHDRDYMAFGYQRWKPGR